MFFYDCLEEFQLDCTLRKLSIRTVKGYYNNIRLFLTFLETKCDIWNIQEITPLSIKKYIQYLMQKKRKTSYINGILKSLRAFFKFAVQEEYLPSSPAEKVSWQKEEKVLVQTFTDEEVQSMLQIFDESSYLSVRNKLILAIAFDTGIRNTELCEMKNKDIRDNVILIHGKGNKERNVPITPYLKKLMLKYERMKSYYFEDHRILYDHYLLSRTGRPLTKEAVERVFVQAGKIATIRECVRCSPHTARHYYAQANLRNGLDVYSLSRLLGHENINITKRYLQSLQDESIVELGAKFSPLMNQIKLR